MLPKNGEHHNHASPRIGSMNYAPKSGEQGLCSLKNGEKEPFQEWGVGTILPHSLEWGANKNYAPPRVGSRNYTPRSREQ